MSLLLWLLLAPALARANDVTDAREHYRKGTTLYDLQRYAEAAREYEAAFEIKDDPALLFNIGQAYRFVPDYGKAIGAFKSYLRRKPAAPNREEVLARIAEMQKLLDDQKQTTARPPGGTIPPGDTRPVEAPADVKPAVKPVEAPVTTAPHDQDRPRTLKLAGIGTGAGGVAVLAAGIALEVLAVQASDRMTHPKPGDVFSPSTESTLKTEHALGVTFLALGSAAVVTGVVLYALGVRAQRAHTVALLPVMSPTTVGGTLHVAF
jgi:tetratricopeptide (TPR) repeat protein